MHLCTYMAIEVLILENFKIPFPDLLNISELLGSPQVKDDEDSYE